MEVCTTLAGLATVTRQNIAYSEIAYIARDSKDGTVVLQRLRRTKRELCRDVGLISRHHTVRKRAGKETTY